MATTKPYESGNPQFDPENHRAWEEFCQRETYVNPGHGLLFLRPKCERRDSEGR